MDDTEITTLHFDLRHITQDTEFTLRAGGGRSYRLIPYAETPEKLAEHRAQNKVLALVDADHLQHLTHYVENAELPAHGISLRSVIFPSLDDHPLPETALEFIYSSTDCNQTAVRLNPWASGMVQFPLVLKHLGISPDAVDDAEMDELRLHAAQIKPPSETAKAILFHHPNLASADCTVVNRVFDNYVKDSQDFKNLTLYIMRHGPGSTECWYEKTWSTWINPKTKKEEPIPARTDIKAKDGKPIPFPTNKATGEPGIPQSILSGDPADAKKGVLGVLAPVLKQILTDTQNDHTLNGALWTKQAGTTHATETNVPPTGPAATAAAPKGWTIKNKTSCYGLHLYANELTYEDNKISFPVKNWPSRYLGAYVEFFKPDGTAIPRKDISGWPDPMWSALRGAFEPSSTKNYLTYISAGNTVFGIPVEFMTTKTTLDFPWPDDAAKANVLVGGLGFAEGFKDWDGDVDVAGALATGLVSYGINIMSLTFTVRVTNPFLKKQSKETLDAIYEAAIFIGLLAGFISALNFKTATAKYILTFLATKVFSILLGKGIEAGVSKAAQRLLQIATMGLMGQITAEEAVEAIPIAGRIIQVASVLADIAALAATTVEVGRAPATYKLEVTRTLDLTVTVKPDPKHAKPGAKPIWPLVADHYIISVTYPGAKGQEGGTTYIKAGPMPGQHDADIAVTFKGIPAGGKSEVVAGIYSANNWLAGNWSSGWRDALPDNGNQLAVSGSITENLVPLTPTTTYSQKQRLVYDSAEAKYLWGVTQFSISYDLATALDARNPAPLRAPFAENGNELPGEDNHIAITVQSAGSKWQLDDKESNTVYEIQRREFYGPDGQAFYELEVQDLTHEIPPIPQVVNDCASDGNRICERVNITVNNSQYQLGYTWKASGMNLPVDNGSAPQNSQMYVFQSISTLGQPGDWIIAPSRGFTQQPYLAFDQFGLKPLFALDFATYDAELNKGGAVSAQLAAAFAGYDLPSDAAITVVTADKEWRIGAAGQTPLFELHSKTTVTDKKEVTVIDVFAYPVPGLDNFWVDPRPAETPDNPDLKLYYLRGVTFPKGESTFDYASGKAWGAFIVPNLNAVAIHPQGYVVGVEWGHFGANAPKMHVLKLPAEAVNEKDAPLAAPLSGFGQREGLMSQPVALTITADGRILVLEQGNKRIQGFDIRANPVQSFAGPVNFTLDPAFVAELDSQTVSLALKQAFQRNLSPWPFYGAPPDPAKQSPTMLAQIVVGKLSSAADLDKGLVDADLLKAFLLRGYRLPEDPSQIEVTVTTKGEVWIITDKVNTATFDMRLLTDTHGEKHLLAFQAAGLAISVTAPGQEWKITDSINAMTFDVKKPISTGKTGSQAAGDLSVQQLVSTMALRDEGAAKIDYLDIAVEAKGYIYVLSKTAESGAKPVYRLDIYNPDGSVLLKEPQTGVNAAKLTVDQWRTMFTLNLDKFLGPDTRTEPGISTWIPSTPGSPGGS